MLEIKNIHSGETVLIVGNGPNLLLSPPENFNYPSIGSNTITRYVTWKPTYYVAVDKRVMVEYGKEIGQMSGVVKLIPTPRLDDWEGDFIRFPFHHKQLWPHEGTLWPSELPDNISYGNVTHVMLQLAYYMGFKTILIIGMEHGKDPRSHFWGQDILQKPDPDIENWLVGYKVLHEGLEREGVKILNLSPNTSVSGDILPRDDWERWSNQV